MKPHPFQSPFLLSLLLGLFIVGCEPAKPAPVQKTEELIAASNAFAELLESVKDAESAREAAKKLDDVADEVIRLSEAMPKWAHKYDGQLIRTETLEQLKADLKAARSRGYAVGLKLKDLRGLPAEFWDKFRVIANEVAYSALYSEEAVRPGSIAKGALDHFRDLKLLYSDYGPARIVTVELTNLPASIQQQAYDKVRAAAGPSATSLEWAEGTKHNMNVAPVDNFEHFVADLDFGTLNYYDAARKYVSFEVDRRALGARANSDEEERRLADLDRQRDKEERDRQWAEHNARLEAEREQNRLEYEAREAELEAERRGPDPNDPNYAEKLVERLESPQYRRDAIAALSSLRPEDVTSPETHKLIAQTFKRLALESRFGGEEEAGIRGLVVWGGKYSTPILLEKLQTDRFANEALYRALGELQDERAARPVAQKLGDFFAHDYAVNSLRTMGSVAEEALIDVVPANNPKACLAAVQLLGACGTEKSLPILRQAISSRNSQVKLEAKAAIRKILERSGDTEE